VDVPPADNSAMDGYAVASADIGPTGETVLPVSQRIPAGTPGGPLAPGTAARIFTGAQVPDGADAVVMQEVCRQEGEAVVVPGPVEAGMNVRRRGEDIESGSELLAVGVRLRAQEIGVAASVGAGRLDVFRRLRVGVFFTGDELAEPGTELRPGQIYNSNRHMLLALLQGLGCEVVDLGRVEDDLASTRDALAEAASRADVVMTSGGVSVGEEDYVRVAVEELGRVDLWRVAIKPGKPLVFGDVHGTPFLGLPGNPVSAFVVFCLFARPFMLAMQGVTDVLPRPLPVRAGFERTKPGKRREYIRVRIRPDGEQIMHAVPHPNQGSGVLTSVSWADGLAVIPEGKTVALGDLVDYLSFTELLG